jgi:hypothetical protein
MKIYWINQQENALADELALTCHDYVSQKITQRIAANFGC